MHSYSHALEHTGELMTGMHCWGCPTKELQCELAVWITMCVSAVLARLRALPWQQERRDPIAR